MTMTIADRLTEAAEHGKWTKRDFQLEIEKRIAKGTSYQTILTYFDGSYEPTLAWIREAALILDVSAEWLAFGRHFSLENLIRNVDNQTLAATILDLTARVIKLERFAADLITELESKK